MATPDFFCYTIAAINYHQLITVNGPPQPQIEIPMSATLSKLGLASMACLNICLLH